MGRKRCHLSECTACLAKPLPRAPGATILTVFVSGEGSGQINGWGEFFWDGGEGSEVALTALPDPIT